MADAPRGEAPANVEAAPAAKPANVEDIEKAVNERLASCNSVKIGEEEFDITVKFEKKTPAAPAVSASTGGKRNRRKTRSKRSARKSHKSRRVFGGKRK